MMSSMHHPLTLWHRLRVPLMCASAFFYAAFASRCRAPRRLSVVSSLPQSSFFFFFAVDLAPSLAVRPTLSHCLISCFCLQLKVLLGWEKDRVRRRAFEGCPVRRKREREEKRASCVCVRVCVRACVMYISVCVCV